MRLGHLALVTGHFVEQIANNAADQVAILIEELKDRDAAIQRQNQVLGAMRVADTRLQGAILAATPADDRIDGFDGHIVVVNERERSVLIRYPRTIGIRPGMLFFVYAPGDQLPLISAKKGIVEIVAVESGTIARGRVLDTSTYAPIITGETPQAERDVLYGKFRSGEVKQLVVSRVANFAVDLPDANVAIQVSGTFGSRQEEAQRLGRVLRPKTTGDNSARFYTVVTRDSTEQEFSARRQLFLTEQGYRYEIEEFDVGVKAS